MASGVDRLGQARDIIGPDDAAEETGAEPASGVVLFELLDAQQTGPSTLEYEYDFGDTWTHVVEVMGPAGLPAGTVRCVGGANRGPVEDARTSGCQRLIDALADPSHEAHQELSDWYTSATGQDAETFEPDAFDGAALNNRLDGLAKRLWPEPPTDEETDAVIRPVEWLLKQAGPDGLQLTQDGYLKPAVVSEAVRALGWSYRWPGLLTGKARRSPFCCSGSSCRFRMEGGEPVPLDAAQDLYLDVRWTLDCLQLKVPEQTFTEEPVLTDGGRKFLLQVQRLLEGV